MSSAAETKKNEGNAFFKQGKYDDAIAAYAQAIELDPSNQVYYSNRSAAYASKGDFASALRDAQQCIRVAPRFVKGYFRAATAQRELGDFVGAVKTLDDGLRAVPNDSDLKALLEVVRPKAEVQQRAMRAGMSPAELLKDEGNELFKAAQFEKAIGKYTEAIRRAGDPGSATALAAYNNRAACHHQLGAHQQVVADCTVVLEHDPRNIKALLRRGLALEALERYRTALDDIRAVLALDPTVEVANRAQHRIGQAVRQLRKGE